MVYTLNFFRFLKMMKRVICDNDQLLLQSCSKNLTITNSGSEFSDQSVNPGSSDCNSSDETLINSSKKSGGKERNFSNIGTRNELTQIVLLPFPQITSTSETKKNLQSLTYLEIFLDDELIKILVNETNK